MCEESRMTYSKVDLKPSRVKSIILPMQDMLQHARE